MSKPIICPECIKENEAQKSVETSENLEGESVFQDGASIMVFTNWIPYAAHILMKHPASDRVEWVISCVKDEVTKYNQANKKIPKPIEQLVELIKSHGATPVLDVGTPLIKTLEEEKPGEVKAEDKIEIIDDWAERLGDINKLGKEPEIDSEQLLKDMPTNIQETEQPKKMGFFETLIDMLKFKKNKKT